jgi:uncharacterized membrane protein YcaP (DUF421 family)
MYLMGELTMAAILLKTFLASAGSFAYLFVITKIMGHRQIAQLDIFDYTVGITIGSIAAELSTELENPTKPIISMAVYCFFGVALSYASSKSLRARKLICGSPVTIMSNGKLHRENMKKAKIDLSEFTMLCRKAGYFDLSQIDTAVFEYNGQMTFLPKDTNRPLTPQDMNLNPEQSLMFVEVIMDGQIVRENLNSMGKDEQWLRRELKKAGYKTQEVFLALCDRNDTVHIYGYTN